MVAGLDMGLTYDKLKHAHYAICRGATFIATNLDATYPDTLTTTTQAVGRLSRRCAPPLGWSPSSLASRKRQGWNSWPTPGVLVPLTSLAVGDRLDTDIAAARAFGCLAVLVLTGISTRAEAEAATGLERPDVTARSHWPHPSPGTWESRGRVRVHSLWRTSIAMTTGVSSNLTGPWCASNR